MKIYNNFPAGHNSADTRGITMSIDRRSRTNQIREQPDKFQIGNETHSAHSGDLSLLDVGMESAEL